MHVSKQQVSSYQENKRFLSRSYTSKEEFVREYKKSYYRKAKAEELYLLVLTEMEKAILEGNVDNFKSFGRFIDYISSIESQATLKIYYNDTNNTIKITNLVILACKHNKVEVLKYIFSNSKVLDNLSINVGKDAIAPGDKDKTCHDAFYYAIRSGNAELLDTLINKWPGDYFAARSEELDEVLSRAYEELKLKNVPLSEAIEIFVESKLINLRFFSNTSGNDRNFGSDLNNIRGRVELVLQNISLLKAKYSNTEKVDEKFLFIAKFIAQNIHILKRQLKSTYNRLPWEEIEFCLVSFVSSHVKQQETNLFYRSTLNKSRVLNHLENFAKKLEDEKDIIGWVNIGKLADLPKLKREKVVAEIIDNAPQFEELYKDYQQIRDIHSLEKISNYIKLALSTDPKEREGQLIITRALQVMGEHLKNTLESPKLSNTTSELLLLSLPKNTRKIIIDLRNSLSHAYSLSKRVEIEESIDANFFANVQNDIKKVGAVTSDIMHNKKLEVISVLLEKISNTKDSNKIKETADILNSIQICKMILEEGVIPKEYDKIEGLIKELKNKINNKTGYEKNLFNAIDNIINSKKSKLIGFKSDYVLQSMDFLLGNKRIDSDGIKEIGTFVDVILANIKPKVGSNSLKEVAKLVMQIYESVKLRVQDEHMNKIIYKIFYIAQFEMSKIEWIEELKGKLDRGEDKKKVQDDNLKKGQNYQERLDQKLSILRDILNENRLSDQLVKKFSSYKKDEKLQSAIEMLVLDIMSILGGSEKHLENNLLFLDDNTPLLTGKCLRNHLAHGNTLVDVLLSDPSIAIILNAKTLVSENVIKSKKRVGKLVRDDPSKLKDKYDQSLVTITNQEKMFAALEEGNLEDLKSYLRKGADINARSSTSWTTLHFAAKGPSLEVTKFILDQNLGVNVKDVKGQSPLHIAAAHGRKNIVEFFVREVGVYVDDLDNSGKTPLHIAAQNGYKDVVELLLKSNANVGIKSFDDFTPLHYAVKNNHMGVIKVLLGKEVSVDINKAKYNMTSLHIASKHGHLELVRFLLQNKADVNVIGYNGWTALHYAAKNGNKGIAHALIKKGANVNAKSAQGDTPLHLAAEGGNIEIIEVLLNSGADINVKSGRNNDTPLHLAAERGYKDIVETLLGKGADGNSKDRDNYTPLHLAALRNDNKEVVEALIQEGADVNTKSKQGDTPLHFAVRYGYEGIVEVLVKEGADINIKDGKSRTSIELAVLCGHLQIVKKLLQHKEANVNAKSNNNCTVLHIAAGKGDVEVTKYLLEKGADVNARSSEDDTPLHWGAENGNKEITKILIKNGASVYTRNVKGLEPIHIAAGCGHKEVVEILIKENANINAEDENKFTPLHCAALYGNLDVIKVLIGKGASVNVRSRQGYTPLYQTALTGSKKIAEVLIEKGADFDAADDDKLTPLHMAASEGHNNVVEVLLKNGVNVNVKSSKDATPIELAVLNDNIQVVRTLLQDERVNINAKDNNNYTILHIAAQTDKLEIVKYLIEKGADFNTQDIYGNTPLHLAAMKGYKKIIEVLKAKGADISIKDNYNRTAEELEPAIAYLNLYGSDSSKIDIAPNNYNLKSREWFEQILKIRENYHGSDHSKVAEVLISLGRTEENLGNNQKAKELLERALKIQDSHYGSESSEIVGTLANLGCIYGKLGNPQKNKELLECALKIQERYYGPDHFEVAIIMVNLSIAYGNLGDPLKKKELLDRALKIQERHYGTDHFAVAGTLVNLGNAYGALGGLQKQKELLEKALEIQKKCCSSDHFSIAITLNNLGAIYLRLGDLHGARELLEQASTIKEKHYGINHCELASTLVNLSTIYRNLGNNQKGKELLERALRIQERYYGSNNFKLFPTLVNLGLAYGDLGNDQKKKELCEQAVSIAEAHYGCDNFEVANSLASLGVAYGDLGDNQKAKGLLERALKIQESHYDIDHFEVASTLLNLGTSYGRLGNHQKKKELLEQALEIQKKHYGSGHPKIVRTLMKLSIAHRNLGDLQQEKILIEWALGIQEKHYSCDSFEVAMVLENLVVVYGNLGEHLNAKKLLERVLHIFEKHYGTDHFEVAKTLVNLVTACAALGDHLNAKKLLERASSISKKYYGSHHPKVLDILKKIEIINLRFKVEGSKVSEVLQHLQKDINIAASKGDVQTVQRLLKDGADVNDKDIEGRTPLYYAVSNGHIDIVNTLLKNGADITQVTNKGNIPLHTATSKGYKEIIEVLLQHVSHDKLKDFINAKTASSGTTSLHVAAQSGSLEVVKSLLKHGAIYDIKNKEGKTPIDLSKDQSVNNLLKLVEELFKDAKKGNAEIINKLKAAKSDEFLAVTNARDDQGNTLLQVAIVNKHKNIASKLLEMLKKPDQSLQDVNIESGVKSLKL